MYCVFDKVAFGLSQKTALLFQKNPVPFEVFQNKEEGTKWAQMKLDSLRVKSQ